MVPMQNPPVGSTSPRANKVRNKARQRVASSWHTRDPIEGAQHPQALYLCPGREDSFTPLRVGWYLAVRVLLIGIILERRMKPPSLDLYRGGGASAPVWSYGEILAHDGPHPRRDI
jgi:hypothetical protein